MFCEAGLNYTENIIPIIPIGQHTVFAQTWIVTPLLNFLGKPLAMFTQNTKTSDDHAQNMQ